MSKRVRLLLVVVLIGLGVWFLYPTFQWYFFIPEEQKELAAGSREQIRDFARNMATEDVNTLKKQVKGSPEAALPAELSFLRGIAEKRYDSPKLDKPDNWNVQAVAKAFTDTDDAFNAIESYHRKRIMDLKGLRDNILKLGLDLSGGMSVVLEADKESLEQRLGKTPTDTDVEDAIARAMEILNNRIDQFGVTEPQIRKQGESQIYIEIPGASDPERIRSFLLGKGSLNFRIVDQEATEALMNYQRNHPEWGPEDKEAVSDIIPVGSEIVGYYQKDDYDLDKLIRYIVIKSDIEEYGLDGSHIQEARVNRDPITNQPTVNFVLDGEGSDRFLNLTEENVGKSLAIVMDKKVKAYARISEAIPSGQVQISGFSEEEARDLALVLRTAAMPVDLEVVSQQSIGASLGADAISQGIRAIAVGFALIIVFMLIYYRLAGIIADLVLIINLFFITAILSAFNLTLTLTSIAGVILTVGMAVDANVIIFERIKEEFKLGKSFKASVGAGFQKAFWTIMDANITTFIAALFLSQLGKGPIQGFAVTLAVGIVTSMFTALFVSRLIFDFLVDVAKVSKLSLSWRKS